MLLAKKWPEMVVQQPSVSFESNQPIIETKTRKSHNIKRKLTVKIDEVTPDLFFALVSSKLE